MTVDMWQAGQGQRLTEMLATDDEVRNRMPLADVAEAVRQPGMRLAQIAAAVMEGYADRPALGQRMAEVIVDASGRHVRRLLPRYETITYRQLWSRARAIASAWHHDPDRAARAGDFVCTLGFASNDYAALELACLITGAVAVPLISNAPVEQWKSIIIETRPRILAVSVDRLDAAVETVISGVAPRTLVVFDFYAEDDAVRETFESARRRLAGAGCPVALESLGDVLNRGQSLPPAPLHVPESDEDPLSQVIYTSGSTGAPKGAMFPERLVAAMWQSVAQAKMPAIVVNYMPMSHIAGRMVLTGGLARGGISYFTARTEMSTLLEDISLVRPTEVFFIPRVCEIILDRFRIEVGGRVAAGRKRSDAEREAKTELREHVLGGRVISAVCGSAPLDSEVRAFMESMLGMQLHDGYGSTEAGGAVMLDHRLRRPPVIEYKLADVPDLGYFGTDKPYPRGELLLKTTSMIPGYYNRPELNAEIFDADGFYRTGDVMAEIGPDELEFVDRRNNVLKLSQAEFVTVSKLEAIYLGSPLVHQVYVYGRSGRPHLLAVIVPPADAVAAYPDIAALKSVIAESLHRVAKDAALHSYEIPHDFLLEIEPFSVENGLLSGIGKMLRPKLNERYAERLEQLYAELADKQTNELAALRHDAADRPVLATVVRAARALVGNTTADLRSDVHFTDLGGDSLSALSFSTLLEDIFGVEVPVSVIVGPATDLRRLANFIEEERASGSRRPTARSLHGDGTEIRAADLTLDKFIDAATLAAAPSLTSATQPTRTVLLTGANGYLGRFLALEWLQRAENSDSRLVCLVRGGDVAAARKRLDAAFDSGDPELLRRYRELTDGRLEVLAGDIGEPSLGLSEAEWWRLADDVDAIVHPAAQVNHVFPYGQLFSPNVGGTAEVIRLAISTRLKPVTYLSTVGIADQIGREVLDEDSDIREISPVRMLVDSYANGYANSKWAGEVLLRAAHDLCGLPVTVFRSNLILAHRRYVGQLNVPDMFTRLLLSVLATWIAPKSFYRTDDAGNRQRAHYDGLPVDFTAEAIITLGSRISGGYRTFNVLNPHDDGVSLDEFVDWLVEAGHPIERIDDYTEWLSRFEIALRALPDQQNQHTVLPLLHAYRHPDEPVPGFALSAKKFEAAVQEAKIGPESDIPQLSRALITKYVTDLQLRGLLAP